MKAMRERRRRRGLRELRLVVRDAASGLMGAPDFRVTIEPGAENGLRVRSQVMADKPVTIRRERIGRRIGRRRVEDSRASQHRIGFCDGTCGVRAINWGALDRVARARETSVSVCSEAVPPASPAEFAGSLPLMPRGQR
jgi:hypothetical protein